MSGPSRALLLAAGLILGAVASAAEVEFLNPDRPSGLPFSEAVRVDDSVYLSGQIGVDPGTGQLVAGGMAAQARQTLDNIRTTLETHGYRLTDVVKCTVMLADMADWAAFNDIYVDYFSPPYPARSAFGATGLALGARLEVECVAVVGRDRAAPPAPATPAAADDDRRVYRRPNAQ